MEGEKDHEKKAVILYAVLAVVFMATLYGIFLLNLEYAQSFDNVYSILAIGIHLLWFVAVGVVQMIEFQFLKKNNVCVYDVIVIGSIILLFTCCLIQRIPVWMMEQYHMILFTVGVVFGTEVTGLAIRVYTVHIMNREIK